MKLRQVLVIAFSFGLLSSQAEAHWCDNLWASSYNIVIRPETDTATSGAMNIRVQNNMGYQLINFKLSASVGGTSITATAPTTLKVPNTLLPGEKGIWKLSGGNLGKIEDVTFSVAFGNSGQSRLYPTQGAKPVIIVKTDGSLYPAPPVLPGLDNPTCCGDVAQARSLQYPAIADFEDLNAGLDKLMTLYCAGRASFGSTDGVSQTYCKTPTSIDACPTTKPGSGNGSKYDYMHLWAAGELAARKAALGAERTAALRARLQCGVNDANIGFAGYALFMLGYLGENAAARSFIESQTSTSGDIGAIAKAALLLMDGTTNKADVQAGLASSSVFVAAASAAALGIAAKDDAAITGTLIPLVKWTEPDTSDNGKGMYAAHLLALVAWDRRGWAPSGGDKGPITFYGDTGTPIGGAGGATGSGGSSVRGGATGSGGATARGGATGSGGATAMGGATGSGGGTAARGGATGSGGATARGGNGGTTSNGGASGSGGTTNAGSTTGPGGTTSGGGETSVGGATGDGGSTGEGGMTSKGGSTGSSGGDTGSGGAGGATGTSGGCTIGGQAEPSLYLLALTGIAGGLVRRRRR